MSHDGVLRAPSLCADAEPDGRTSAQGAERRLDGLRDQGMESLPVRVSFPLAGIARCVEHEEIILSDPGQRGGLCDGYAGTGRRVGRTQHHGTPHDSSLGCCCTAAIAGSKRRYARR